LSYPNLAANSVYFNSLSSGFIGFALIIAESLLAFLE
jgi:hypothetical protein